MSVVGARPNMVKMAPILRAMRRTASMEPVLVHTGQHYDYMMSQVFFEQLHLPEPNYNLEVGSGSHYVQTAEVMKRFGEVVEQDRPRLIVVAGDVNSTVACALVAAKECIPLVHVEAGLRSGDRTMPEEINRIVTDSISDVLFTTEESGNVHLRHEGVADNKIYFVGNAMIDSLSESLEAARRSELVAKVALPRGGYGVLTLHRPSNVDSEDRLLTMLRVMSQVAEEVPIVFPAHPRTRARIEAMGEKSVQVWDGVSALQDHGIWVMPPASYLDFIGMMDGAAFVITDSGGVQEETTFLGIQCLTVRDNTERPSTITYGTNRLVGTNPDVLLSELSSIVRNGAVRETAASRLPPLWDGHAGERMVRVLEDYLGSEPG